jgi:hypothetical protein
MSRPLDLISPRVKAISAGMVSRDRKEKASRSSEQNAAPTPPAQPEVALTKMEMEGLQRVFASLTSSSSVAGKFGKSDLESRFDLLGYKPQKVTDFGLSECEVRGSGYSAVTFLKFTFFHCRT